MREDGRVIHLNGTVITATNPVQVVNQSAYLAYVIFSIVAPGSSWKLTVQDKSSPTKNVLIPPFDFTPAGPDAPLVVKEWEPKRPCLMNNGIEILSAGTAGEAFMWVWFVWEPPQT